MTFSLVAACPETGQTGMVIASSSPAVAARCAHGRAGVGSVASQNVTDPRLGARVLDLMAEGRSPQSAVDAALSETRHGAYRQILAVSVTGETGLWSGAQALGVWAQARGQGAVAGGNLLAHDGVPAAMIAGFSDAKGDLASRLLGGLRAGLRAGGEAGAVHSAGLLVQDREAWPFVDLRCDWSETCPIDAVAQAWEIYRPQAAAYVQRALDPGAAPSYGVPGDP